LTHDPKKRLRKAMADLRTARCTCTGEHDRDPVYHPPGRHDPYDIRCPQAVAEIERDNALADMGVVL